jgi:hypothetical protein
MKLPLWVSPPNNKNYSQPRSVFYWGPSFKVEKNVFYIKVFYLVLGVRFEIQFLAIV